MVDFALPEERPHGGRAAAVARGLPAVHADARTTRIFEALAGDDAESAIADKTWYDEDERAVEHHRQPVRPGPRRRSSTSPTATRSTTPTASTASSASRPRAPQPNIPSVSRLRVPGRRGGHRGGVPAATCCSRSTSPSPPADPGNPVSHMGNTVRDFYVDTFAQSCGDPQTVQATASGRSATCRSCATGSTAGRSRRCRPRTGPAASATARTPASTTTASAAWSPAPSPATRSRCGSPGGRTRALRALHLRAREGERHAKVLIMADENYTGPTPGQDPDGAEVPDVLHRRAGRERRRLRRLRRRPARTRPVAGLRWACSATTTRWSGTRATTTSPAGPGSRGGTGTARFNLEEEIDVARLPQRGRQAVLHRQERRPAVGRGLRGPQLRVPRAAARAASGARAAKPEFDKDDPTLADGCIAHNNDFLQYYLGAYVYVPGGQSTDPEVARAVRHGRLRPARRPRLEVRRDRRRQPGELGDLPGHEHDPGPGALPDVRELAQHRQLAAAGRGAVRSVHGREVHGRGRGRRVVQAAPPDRRPHRQDRRAS